MTDGNHSEAYVSIIINVYTGASDLNEYNYAADAPEYTGSNVTYADFAPTSAGGNSEYGDLGVAMRKAAKRIIYPTLTSNAICGYSSDSKVVRITPLWKKTTYALDITAGVLCAASVIWIGVTLVLDLKKKAK